MGNNRKICNFHFFMIFYLLVDKEYRNTYNQPVLVKPNKNCGNYKRKYYRQRKKSKNNTKMRNLL